VGLQPEDGDDPVSGADAARLVEYGRRAHPDIEAEPGLVELVVARARAALSAPDVEARAADIYLAAACVAARPAAVARLDARIPELVRPALARLGLPESEDDEIVQRVRIALLTPDDDGVPGIAGYSGRGDLRSYIRAIAVRLALRRLEREREPSTAGDDRLALIPAADDSPEVRMLKERYRDEVGRAFARALDDLSAQKRTLLRQYYIDGLTVDILGRLHGVHRATAARWVEAARASVVRAVRRHLRGTLGLGASELDSIVGLVKSGLDVSLTRLLASRE
jgi:RNA polymerase sigma-70 factor (ECF subfamily)